MQSANKICLFVSIFIMFTSSLSFAGKLDDFEKDTEKKKDKTSKDNSISSDLAGAILGAISSALIVGTVEGIKNDKNKSSQNKETTQKDSNKAEEKPSEKNLVKWPTGDPMVPFARIDASYQHLSSKLKAWDCMAEFGYEFLALNGRFTHYMEKDPDDSLDAAEGSILLRMPFCDHVEVDLGAGFMSISGDKTHSGGSVTLPIKIRPVKYLEIELRPLWADINGNFMQDYDAGIVITGRYAGVRAGYRWLLSPGECLDGPYLGISIFY